MPASGSIGDTCSERSRSRSSGGDRRRRTQWSAPSSLPATTIVGEGFHERFGEAHAEVSALRAAGDRARGATMYVTLEPCAHHGKTPPCVDAIIAAGVARVVVAVRDPSSVARGGVERLRAAGVHVDIGVERDAALRTQCAVLLQRAAARSPVGDAQARAVGRRCVVADPTGAHRWITGPESRRDVHRLRANARRDRRWHRHGARRRSGTDRARRAPAASCPSSRRVRFDAANAARSSKLVRTARETSTTVSSRTRPSVSDRRRQRGFAGIGRRRSWPARRCGDALEARCAPAASASLLVGGGAALGRSLPCANRSSTASLSFSHRWCSAPARRRRSSSRPPDSARRLAIGFASSSERQFGDDIMTTYALHEISCLPD